MSDALIDSLTAAVAARPDDVALRLHLAELEDEFQDVVPPRFAPAGDEPDLSWPSSAPCETRSCAACSPCAT